MISTLYPTVLDNSNAEISRNLGPCNCCPSTFSCCPICSTTGPFFANQSLWCVLTFNCGFQLCLYFTPAGCSCEGNPYQASAYIQCTWNPVDDPGLISSLNCVGINLIDICHYWMLFYFLNCPFGNPSRSYIQINYTGISGGDCGIVSSWNIDPFFACNYTGSPILDVTNNMIYSPTTGNGCKVFADSRPHVFCPSGTITNYPFPDSYIIGTARLTNFYPGFPCITLQSPPRFSAQRGLGDDIEIAMNKLGVDKLAKLYEKVTGLPCGCSERKELLNKLPSVWDIMKKFIPKL